MTTLLDLVPNLKKIANTHGGEFAGPCPLCGGKDRFHAQPAFAWQDGDLGAWFCRQCSPHWDDTPALVMRLHNCTYPEALRLLGASHSTLNTQRPTHPPAPPSTPTPPPRSLASPRLGIYPDRRRSPDVVRRRRESPRLAP